MRQATLRFYAELVDFVDDPGGLVTRRFHVAGSVKDLIESCGVPHTEVDLVLVNGEPVTLSHRVADGDRVSVYPVFEAFDISAVTRVRSAALRDPRFVLDVHLGRLARYLRLVGFDVDYATDRVDRELIEISVTQQRILLTRDVELLKDGRVTHGAFVHATDPTEQLQEIVGRFHLSTSLRPFTRCLVCNGELERGADDRSSCRSCDRLYWRGSHFPRLEELVTLAREA